MSYADLVEEIMGFHDCMDNSGPGDGRFSIRMDTGVGDEQMRLNLRAVLREAADAIKALTTPKDGNPCS